MADSEVGLALKVGSFIVAAVGVLLVNNRFVLGKVSTCNKEVNDKIVNESKEAVSNLDKNNKELHQRIDASEMAHEANCRLDRQDMIKGLKTEMVAMETRLKEFMRILIEAKKT